VRQLKLMQLGLKLQMTRIAVAYADGTVNNRFTLQVGVAVVIDARLVLHIYRRRTSGGCKERNNKDTKNTMHNSVRLTIDEKLYFISD
jgi:hypothetical protein